MKIGATISLMRRCITFPQVFLTTLPILFNTHDQSTKVHKPFRYEVVWSTHGNFSKIINDVWAHKDNENKAFYLLYKIFKSKAIWWKKNVFGNIDLKLVDIRNKLDRVSFDMETSYFGDIHILLIKLEKEHQFMLLKQENFIGNKWLELIG